MIEEIYINKWYNNINPNVMSVDNTILNGNNNNRIKGEWGRGQIIVY